MRFLGITKIPIQVLQHYRNGGRHSGGAKPLERLYFRSETNLLFALMLGMYFLPFYHSVNPSGIQGLE